MTRFSPMRRFLSQDRWLLLLAVMAGLWGMLCTHAAPTFHATALTQVATNDIAAQLGLPPEPNSNLSPAQQASSPAQKNVDHFNDLLNDDLPEGFVDAVLKKAAIEPPLNVYPLAQDANLDQPINFNPFAHDRSGDSSSSPGPPAHDPRFVKLLNGLHVSATSQTAYAIELTWDNPAECRRIVEAFREEYIEEVGREREAASIQTISFLDDMIKRYAQRLSQTEQAMIRYRTNNPGELPEAQNTDISQLRILQAQLDDIRISQRDAAMKRQALMQRIAGMKSTGAVVAPTLLQQLVDANIAQKTQQAKMTLVQQEIAWYRAVVARIPNAQLTLSDMTREYPVVLAQYRHLVQVREQVQLRDDLERMTATSSFQPIGAVYALPVKPDAWEDPRVGVVVAVVSACLYVTLLVRRRRSVSRVAARALPPQTV